MIRMLARFLCLLILTGGHVSAQATNPDPPTGVRVDPDLTRLRDQLAESFAARDLDALEGLLGPNVVLTWQNGSRTVGRQEFREFFDQMFGGNNSIITELKTTRQVTNDPVVDGDFAVAWGTSNDKFKLRDGDEFALESVWTATLRKHESGWQVMAYHVSTDAFNNPMLTTAKKYLMTFATVGTLLGFSLGAILTWFVMSSTRRLTDKL